MSAETNHSVEDQEVAAPEAEEQALESKETQESEQRKRNDAEYNWAELRRARERDREELEALKKELNSFRTPSAPPEDDDLGIGDDDLAEGKHLKTLKKELSQLKKELQHKEQSSMEERLQIRFPDYESIVTPENIKLAEKLEPELAEMISEMKDPYKQRVRAYQLLKKVADHGKDTKTLEKARASENSQKPLSVNAVTQNSAIGNAHLFENGLTQELKNQLWQEMQEIRKRT